MKPTLEQILALFSLCHLCGKNAHPNTRDCCDECHEKTCTDAYNDCLDNYGSSDF